MRAGAAFLLLSFLTCSSCGGTASPGVGSPDATTASDTGAGGDGATGDGGVADAGSSDATRDVAITPCQDCVADWCGCGQCDPSDIVCTKTPLACPLGCPSACEAQADVKCGCAGDRCVFVSPTRATPACYQTADCPPGMCCGGRDAGFFGRGRCVTEGSPGCR